MSVGIQVKSGGVFQVCVYGMVVGIITYSSLGMNCSNMLNPEYYNDTTIVCDFAPMDSGNRWEYCYDDSVVSDLFIQLGNYAEVRGKIQNGKRYVVKQIDSLSYGETDTLIYMSVRETGYSIPCTSVIDLPEHKVCSLTEDTVFIDTQWQKIYREKNNTIYDDRGDVCFKHCLKFFADTVFNIGDSIFHSDLTDLRGSPRSYLGRLEDTVIGGEKKAVVKYMFGWQPTPGALGITVYTPLYTIWYQDVGRIEPALRSFYCTRTGTTIYFNGTAEN